MINLNCGRVELQYTNSNQTLQIAKLYPFFEEGVETTYEHIDAAWNGLKLPIEMNQVLVNWYLKKVLNSGKVIPNIPIATAKSPIKINSSMLKFSNEEFRFDDDVYWCFVYNLFKYMDSTDLTQKLPFKLHYTKAGDVIATQSLAREDIPGQTLAGEKILPNRSHTFSYKPGDNVQFDPATNTYIATACGYVLLYEGKISVIPPFYVTSDNMLLHFTNYDRTPEAYLDNKDIVAYFKKTNIDIKALAKNLDLKAPAETPIIIAQGKHATESVDASLEFFVDTETRAYEIDTMGQVNYREVQKFPSAEAEQLLVKKIKASWGESGYDLFGKTIPARSPKDIVIKNGKNTLKDESDTEILIYSTTEGLIEYKSNTISIFDQLKFNDDINYQTGNIDTRVNVQINGSVRTGFKVKSEKNVFIRGTIEDNCVIEAGGDLVINGGSSGLNNVLICNGNMAIKFIEGGKIFVKGSLAVQSSIVGADVECLDSISVMGSGINLNDKGAIINSKILVKNDLHCPAVGNKGGLKTYITFAHDKHRELKIHNFEETLAKITQAGEKLNEKYNIDLGSTTIQTKIKNLPPAKRDAVMLAMAERVKLDNQYKMISSILVKEQEQKKENMTSSSINITRKVFPPLHLECDHNKKVIDTEESASRFYFDMEEYRIERSRYGTTGGGGEASKTPAKSQ